MNLESIKKWFRHNTFISVAIVISAILLVWAYGCNSTTKSPWNPEVNITRAELEAEIEMLNAKIRSAYADLERQDLFKQELFNIGVILAEGGTVNPVGAGIGLLGILGLGAVADNRKKNAVIKTLQKA